MKEFSYITNSHPNFIESLYNQYKDNPKSVDEEYKKFFDGFDFAINKVSTTSNPSLGADINIAKEFGVVQLIRDYKKKGHLLSDTNPIRPRKDRNPQLELSYFGLTDSDLSLRFHAGSFIGMPNATLQKIVNKLQLTYAGKFGVEYTYIRDNAKIKWLEEQIQTETTTPLSIEEKTRIIQKLTESSVFETFLHKKYIGQKRFSLEGGENTITLLDQIVHTASENHTKEIVIGMAHRGRLNVLANILNKTYEQIFSEFEGMSPIDSTMGSGDVKYHMGFSGTIKTSDDKDMYLKLAPNPSHLETVGSIVTGYTKNKAALLYANNTTSIIPIIIHGDASIAGQGIVYELLQMSQLEGYTVGGTIHVVINNQIGFTTDYFEARSSDYCTSIASTIQAPVFHVNGDDAETIAKVARIVTRYRQRFKEDIFVDILCYRKHGHNEGDDPKYTQPSLYNLIEQHKSPREIYLDHLARSSREELILAKEMEDSFWENLQTKLDNIKKHPLPYSLQQYKKRWEGFRKATKEDFKKSPSTSISKKEIEVLINEFFILPKEFEPLPKIKNQLKDKLALFREKKMIDWATAELLAYASLQKEGIAVRLSGQDVIRGTFSHRHSKLLSSDGLSIYDRLNTIKNIKANAFMRNSVLSEYAVLGFEYGYSISTPNCLVIWEAQFGDFVNGAQIILDQYITTAEEKWGIASGLTLFLPHGYEGQGPEHSSARIERILQLSAENNIFVTNVTTAANFFHVLRRQLQWPFRKPLINFSPKANLRHVDAYSHVDSFTKEHFQEVITDHVVNIKKVKKVLVCSGKLYFDLNSYRKKNKIDNIAIIRLEQLHPFPYHQWEMLIKQFPKKTKWVWVQEEPKNMGALSYLKIVWEEKKGYEFISRPASASTATGFYNKHKMEQQIIIEEAFKL